MWPAWKQAMPVANIQSGFHKTGIYPVNFDGISKSKFTPSQVTDSKTCSVFLTVCVTVRNVHILFQPKSRPKSKPK